MNQRRRPARRPVNGVLMLDKPYGMSSNDALQKARRLLNAARRDTPARSIRWRPACCR